LSLLRKIETAWQRIVNHVGSLQGVPQVVQLAFTAVAIDGRKAEARAATKTKHKATKIRRRWHEPRPGLLASKIREQIMSDELQRARNSLDVLEATVKNLILNHQIAKAKLVSRHAEIARLKGENETLTQAVKDMALKLAAAETESGEKNEQT